MVKGVWKKSRYFIWPKHFAVFRRAGGLDNNWEKCIVLSYSSLKLETLFYHWVVFAYCYMRTLALLPQKIVAYKHCFDMKFIIESYYFITSLVIFSLHLFVLFPRFCFIVNILFVYSHFNKKKYFLQKF